ncbi:MAG: nitrile hydratase subunit alpha [Hyphomicrobiales bacterium]|nr:nitrile hydratase subunit alpha [Hyphomicrobiales bacterium]
MSAEHEHAHDHEHEHGHDHAHAHGHEHAHDHDHGAPHPLAADDTSPPGRYELMIMAMRDLLIEKDVITAEQVRKGFETLDSWQPARGAQIVARAWTDPAYKARLLADGNEAIADFGLNMGGAKLTVVENTDDVQNVIVCTLCSCYPRAVLGLPPDWYRSKAYRARVVVEPRAVVKELGLDLPDDVAIRVHDSLADLRYLVIPRRPAGTEGWNEAQLAAIVTRDCMVGVANPQVS